MPKNSTVLKTSSGTYVGSVSPPSPATALQPQSSNGSLFVRVMITTSLKKAPAFSEPYFSNATNANMKGICTSININDGSLQMVDVE